MSYVSTAEVARLAGAHVAAVASRVASEPTVIVKGLDFGEAVRSLKSGYRVARAGWNGKGMWLVLLRPGKALPPCALPCPGLPPLDLSPCIAMKTAGGDLQPGWLASQPDMLAEDWMVVR